MGLLRPSLRFLARQHKRKPFGGSILTLGRQCVHGSLDHIQRMLVDEGITAHALPPGMDTKSNVEEWMGNRLADYTNDVVFFRLLGIDDVQSMDFSDFEGSEVVHDLNEPVPENLHEKYDLIVDGGTIEHIFDTRMVLSNISKMLRPGGRIVHLTPSNNYTNHGFYQCSPTLYIDYYRANGFCDQQVYLGEEIVRNGITVAMDVFQFDPEHQPARLISPRPMTVLFSAEKTTDSTSDVVPTQGFYRQLLADEQEANVDNSTAHSNEQSWKTRIGHRLPTSLQQPARSCLDWFRKSILRQSPFKRPWGLKFSGRLD